MSALNESTANFERIFLLTLQLIFHLNSSSETEPYVYTNHTTYKFYQCIISRRIKEIAYDKHLKRQLIQSDEDDDKNDDINTPSASLPIMFTDDEAVNSFINLFSSLKNDANTEDYSRKICFINQAEYLPKVKIVYSDESKKIESDPHMDDIGYITKDRTDNTIYMVIDRYQGEAELSINAFAGTIIENQTTLEKYKDHLLKYIAEVYITTEKGDPKLLKDFCTLYLDYSRMVGVIRSFSTDSLIHYDEPNRTEITKEMENQLIKVARSVLAEEINYNLSGVKFTFDPLTMENKLEINTLLEAMYLSLSYIMPNTQIYKRCPTCYSYFLANNSNPRKKYCSKSCQNNRRTEQKK